MLAVADFSMMFTDVLCGWEGTACDSTVFADACATNFKIWCVTNFKILAGQYYLADAGYVVCNHLLVLYHWVGYHLKEWMAAKNRSVAT